MASRESKLLQTQCRITETHSDEQSQFLQKDVSSPENRQVKVRRSLNVQNFRFGIHDRKVRLACVYHAH